MTPTGQRLSPLHAPHAYHSDEGSDDDQPTRGLNAQVSVTGRNTLKRSGSPLEQADAAQPRNVRYRGNAPDFVAPALLALKQAELPENSDEGTFPESVQDPLEKKAPASISSLPRDVLLLICKLLDRESIKTLREASKFLCELVDSRGHIKFRRLSFMEDYEIETMATVEDTQDYKKFSHFKEAFFYDAFKSFLKKLRNLRSVDLSKVDNKLDEIIPLIVNNNPGIRHIDLGCYLCEEDWEGHEKKISSADLRLIDETCKELESDETCKGLRSLALSANFGDHLDYLLRNKPPEAFKSLNKLSLMGYKSAKVGVRKDSPLLFFTHIIFAYPNLQELIIADCRMDFTSPVDWDKTSSLTHLTLSEVKITNDADALIALVKSLSRFCPNLSHFTFSCENFNHKQLADLARSCPGLKTINLCCKQRNLSDDEVKQVKRDFPSLEMRLLAHLPLPRYYSAGSYEENPEDAG